MKHAEYTTNIIYILKLDPYNFTYSSQFCSDATVIKTLCHPELLKSRLLNIWLLRLIYEAYTETQRATIINKTKQFVRHQTGRKKMNFINECTNRMTEHVVKGVRADIYGVLNLLSCSMKDGPGRTSVIPHCYRSTDSAPPSSQGEGIKPRLLFKNASDT